MAENAESGQNLAKNGLIEDLIQDFIARNLQRKIVIAFSGGLDSSVLLHLLATHHPNPENLRAIYINHGLQQASGQWALHCESVCLGLGISFKEIKVQLSSPRRKGIEAVAREARYQALFGEIEASGCLVTGHHQRDQAETFLLALMRGSGSAGLSAMPITRFHQVADKSFIHSRPLLGASFSALKHYAETHSLSWIEDPSNHSLEFNRNVIRHNVLPVLEDQWPAAVSNIAHSASLQAESIELMDALARQDMQSLDFTCRMIDLSSTFELGWVRQKNLIRFWLMHEVGIQVTQTILNWLAQTLNNPNPQAHPKLQLSGSDLRIHQKKLYYVTKLNFATKVRFSKSLFEEFGLTAQQTHWVLKQSFYHDAKESLFVRSIAESESDHAKALKKWFKQNKIPPWQRSIWPVFEVENQVVAILEFWVKAE